MNICTPRLFVVNVSSFFMRTISTRAHVTLGLAAVICIYWMITTTAALCQDSGKPRKLNREVEHCDRIKDDRERMRCEKEEGSAPSTNFSQQQPPEPGSWQLARTPNPAGGPESISIMKSANTTGSDQDILSSSGVR
jgi:hypothetical protein